jgi:hypothetical protein
MHSALRLLLLVLLIVTASACASTSFTHTWKAPDALSVEPHGRKVAAVYITSDESGRRVAEDVLAQKLDEHGARGVASYSLIPSSSIQDMEFVRSRLAAAGVEGILTMRVIDEKQEISITSTGYRPGFDPYYGTFTRYWPYGWDYPYEPTARANRVLRVETLVYSLERDALLWAGTSRTVNPKVLPAFVAGLADVVSKRLMQQGLLPGTTGKTSAAAASTGK